MYHILIVEDDRSLNQGIALALKEEDVSFYQAYTIAEARTLLRDRSIDMVLLDINLPDGSGYDFLKEIRNVSELPVLMITANDMESDEVTGFSLGADDYITKPFSLMALRARVGRMRQRTASAQTKKEYSDERYVFLFDNMKFYVEGEEIILSKTEQKLLRCFVENRGQTLTRDRLMDIIWEQGGSFVEENALSVAVNRLRHKLEGKDKTCPIRTVYGIGYVWEKGS
ncbi:MAG TPA: response regulator transcription factor [Candidatus Mediterraneibacter merdavium]|nr:response regulator transcription factor [Candidatus Mediterraneibacter merdavium]